MKLVKRLIFTILGCIVILLIVATLLEKIYGTAFVADTIYGSWVFVALWAILVCLGLIYMVRRKLQKRLIPFLLHGSFVIILMGAFTTYLFGKQGILHLRQSEKASAFVCKDGGRVDLPFSVTLDRFDIVYYPGTPSPMDYVSVITVADKMSKALKGKVAMNQIFSYKGYRFYQSGYDDDGLGTTFAVAYDPYGIGITYIGYGLLFLSMFLFLIAPGSRFRRLIKTPLLRKTIQIGLTVVCLSGSAYAAENPKVLPKDVAAEFGNLYVLYNNRICPLQTLAKDFTTKLYGKPTYRGLTSEQVFTGWMFYYSTWKQEPMIKVKSMEVRKLLDVEEGYASLDDYFTSTGEYRIDKALNDIRMGLYVPDRRGIEEANEKYNILRIFYSGEMMKIFPCKVADDTQLVKWFSQGDVLPDHLDDDHWFFIRKSQDYIHEMVIKKDYEGIVYTLQKIKTYQQKEAATALPSDLSFKAEKIYNRLNVNKWIAICCLAIGLCSFIYYGFHLVLGHDLKRVITLFLLVLLGCLWVYLSACIALRWVICGYIPLANGYETMQFMAWCSLLLTFLLQRKLAIALPFGFIVCGLTLMVSLMGESNPQITQLMPVLSSPLLSVHVAVIMVAYSLFAFMMLNGIMAVCLHFFSKELTNKRIQIERLQIVSHIMLYPALFCLAAGIFVGAIWANISWGRYWGWDPKEVWALITLLIYAFAVHTDSLPWFRRPVFFHVFAILAFFSVLITYFGVNFILGGMHSYA